MFSFTCLFTNVPQIKIDEAEVAHCRASAVSAQAFYTAVFAAKFDYIF